MFDHKLCLIPHDSFVNRQAGLNFSEHVISSSEIHQAKILFEEDSMNPTTGIMNVFVACTGESEPMSNDLLSTALLQCGVDLSNYSYDKQNRKLNLKIKSYDGKHLDKDEHMELLSSVGEKEANKFISFEKVFNSSQY